uniref:hypothetical protein n=1 Tax=Candidatus Wunengus sp. YC61 TaxID=3367698 RepID=UPI004027F905
MNPSSGAFMHTSSHHTERTHPGVRFSAVTGKKTGKNRVCIYTSEETKTKDHAAISLEKRRLRRVAVHFPLKYIVLPEINEFQKEGTSKISVSMDCASKQRRESSQVAMP